MISLEFKEKNQYIYILMSVGNFVTLVHHVDDIILIINNVNLLNATKHLRHFKMKELGDASFMLDIQIHHDKCLGISGVLEIV